MATKLSGKAFNQSSKAQLASFDEVRDLAKEMLYRTAIFLGASLIVAAAAMPAHGETTSRFNPTTSYNDVNPPSGGSSFLQVYTRNISLLAAVKNAMDQHKGLSSELQSRFTMFPNTDHSPGMKLIDNALIPNNTSRDAVGFVVDQVKAMNDIMAKIQPAELFNAGGDTRTVVSMPMGQGFQERDSVLPQVASLANSKANEAVSSTVSRPGM
jgi:hypothetical protein